MCSSRCLCSISYHESSLSEFCNPLPTRRPQAPHSTPQQPCQWHTHLLQAAAGAWHDGGRLSQVLSQWGGSTPNSGHGTFAALLQAAAGAGQAFGDGGQQPCSQALLLQAAAGAGQAFGDGGWQLCGQALLLQPAAGAGQALGNGGQQLCGQALLLQAAAGARGTHFTVSLSNGSQDWVARALARRRWQGGGRTPAHLLQAAAGAALAEKNLGGWSAKHGHSGRGDVGLRVAAVAVTTVCGQRELVMQLAVATCSLQ